MGQVLAQSVAISDKNHHIYVADTGRGTVYNFTGPANVAPAAWDGSNTPSGSFGGGHVSVAVDNTTGDVFVADVSHALIDKFDQNGKLITSFGDALVPDGQLTGAATPAGFFLPPIESYSSFPIAVNQATHDLYVADPGHEVIDIFDENGAYLRQITATPPGLYESGGARTTGIAVNATSGTVYLSDWEAHKIFQFDSSGSFVRSWGGEGTPQGDFGGSGSPLEVATEDSTGKVYVMNWAHDAVDVFDENGNFLPPALTNADLGGQYVRNSEGVAVDQANGELYVSSDNAGRIQVFKPVIVPDPTMDPVAGPAATSATLTGHVDPAGGGPITDCHFEYISRYEYLADRSGEDPWTAASVAPCAPAAFSTPSEVSSLVTGLSPGTIYHARLIAANAAGGNRTSGLLFATAGHYLFSTKYGSAGSGDGQLSGPSDVAVDNSNGDVYVADTGNHRVVKFGSSGNFLAAWGWGVSDAAASSEVCTSSCQAGIPGSGSGQFSTPAFIEVDNSSSPSAGDVYVADTADGVVQKFDPSGHIVAGWVQGGSIDRSHDGTIGGITVDQVGNLYVLTDNEPFFWTQISEAGNSQIQFRTDGEPGLVNQLGPPGGTGIDIGSTGTWYETVGPGRGGVRYSSPEATIYSAFVLYGFPQPGYGADFEPDSGLALNRSTNDAFVDQGAFIDRFAFEAGCKAAAGNSGCFPSDSFGLGDLTSAAGLAVKSNDGTLYAADHAADDVAVFSARPLPELTTGPDTNQTPTSVTLNGHVDPKGAGAITDCHFEYGTDITYSMGTIPCSPTPSSSPTDVAAGVTGLSPFTTYHYRLAASGAEDLGLLSYSHDATFTPVQGTAPTVGASSSSGATPTTVTLSTQINPNLASTIYRFEYGIEPKYGSQTLPSESIGSDSNPHSVSTLVSGLQPGTTYHFRAVAVNFNGVTAGPDQTFSTPSAPDVGAAPAADITQTSVTLGASIAPGFRPTTYHFEYGLTTTYTANTAESGSIGADNSFHPVTVGISGLRPETTYHFRVVATNSIDSTVGPDQAFTTASQPPIAPIVTPQQPSFCKPGFVKKHGKCVKRRKHRKHKRRSQ